jgi:hypothetical protein
MYWGDWLAVWIVVTIGSFVLGIFYSQKRQ